MKFRLGTLCLFAALLTVPAVAQETAERAAVVSVPLTVIVEQAAADSAGPQSEDRAKPATQISEPTHRQLRVMKPEKDGKQIQLHSFCVNSTGQVLAVCESNESPGVFSTASTAKRTSSPVGCIVVFEADGAQKVLCDLPFIATAITAAPDGTIFAAGNGKVGHLTSAGEMIKLSKAPNMGDEEEVRKQAEEGAKLRRAQYAEAFESQITVLKERVETLSKKEESKRSRADTARLDSYKEQLEMYEGLVDGMGITVDSILAQGLSITAISANEKDVFVSCGSLTNSGYAIWRMNHELEEPKELVPSIGGCCGQMDLHCCEEGFAVAENTSFQVGLYDRDGNRLDGFGKSDRTSNDGFGSCCNPMNVYSLPDGKILTAESSVGHIKCFDKQGNFISYIGRAKIGGGCKHCSIGYDSNSDQYYMMHQDVNGICVLANSSKMPAMTDEERAVSVIREKFQDRLLGTWEIGEQKATENKNSGSFVSALASVFGFGESDQDEVGFLEVDGFQLPWTKVTFVADGGLTASGGMYGSLSNADYTWTWEIKPDSTDQQLNLMIAMDQVEYYTVSIRFQDENQAGFTFDQYGSKQPEVNAKRVADCEGKPCGDANCETPVANTSN